MQKAMSVLSSEFSHIGFKYLRQLLFWNRYELVFLHINSIFFYVIERKLQQLIIEECAVAESYNIHDALLPAQTARGNWSQGKYLRRRSTYTFISTRTTQHMISLYI